MVEEHREPVIDAETSAAPARRRRTPRRKPAEGDAAQEVVVSTNGATPAPPERGARRRSARAKSAAPADAPEAQVEAAPVNDEGAAPEKPPRRRRASAKKADAPASEAKEQPDHAEVEAPESPATPETPKAPPARRRRRSTPKPAAEAEAPAASEAVAEAPSAATPAPSLPDSEATSLAGQAAAALPVPADTASASTEPPVDGGPSASQQEADDEATPHPRRKRRRRGRRRGHGLRQTAEQAVAGIPPLPEIEEPFPDEEDDEEEDEEGEEHLEHDAAEAAGAAAVERGPHGRRRRGGKRHRSKATPDASSKTDHSANLSFMHPSEREFAHLLEYYGIKYLYEPRSFPLRWEGERVVQMFTPDFYLPEYDQYFELTTMKQSLVTQKNRKLRMLRELYPDINIQLLYRRDLMRLMGKYGFGPLAEVNVEGTERVLYTEQQVRDRVKELGKQITKDYAGKEPVLIGVLRGVVVFMADLMREIDLPLQIEFMEISHYGEEREDSIEVIRDVGTDLVGRDVLLVEDIVDTGLTLRYLLEHLKEKKPASIKVCTLLDKSARRMANVPLDYVGFEVPDEFVIGYGLDYGGRYRNLRYIGVLKPVEPKAVAQR